MIERNSSDRFRVLKTFLESIPSCSVENYLYVKKKNQFKFCYVTTPLETIMSWLYDYPGAVYGDPFPIPHIHSILHFPQPLPIFSYFLFPPQFSLSTPLAPLNSQKNPGAVIRCRGMAGEYTPSAGFYRVPQVR